MTRQWASPSPKSRGSRKHLQSWCLVHGASVLLRADSTIWEQGGTQRHALPVPAGPPYWLPG